MLPRGLSRAELRVCRGAMGIAMPAGVAVRPECPSTGWGVGAQWELRRALARTDQRLGHYDASMRAHVQRRFPPGDRPFRLLFEPAAAAAAPHRGTRPETAIPSGPRPACREEAESRTGATEFCRSTPRRASHRRALDAGGNARSGGGRSRPSPSDLRPRAALSDVN